MMDAPSRFKWLITASTLARRSRYGWGRSSHCLPRLDTPPRSTVPGQSLLGAAGENADVRADRRKAAADRAVAATFILGCSEHARRLAGLSDAADGVLDHRHHRRIAGLSSLAQVGMQVGRADEHAINAIDGANGLDVLQRLLRLHLHQHAQFVVRAVGVIPDPTEARRARVPPVTPRTPSGG